MSRYVNVVCILGFLLSRRQADYYLFSLRFMENPFDPAWGWAGFSSPTTQRASSTQFAVTRSRSGFINLVSDGLPSYSTGCAMFKCLHTICEELIWLLWEDRPG